ncbi:MAG: DsbE family thiol:disulfide interchange protein [Rhodobacterales bacterium]|nr:MAG: DsbE family thiol:disulfide interchange protein [Rhodobacterales bacterium]
MAKVSPLMFVPPLVFAAIAGVFFLGLGDDHQELPSVLVGTQAPVVPEDALTGEPTFTLDDLTGNGVQLVNFWASWCGPCRVEHPNLEALAEKGLVIYGVNYKDQPGNAADFLAEMGNPYTALTADTNGRAALEWGVYGVPETFIVGNDGTILGRMAGPVTTTTIEQRLLPVLAKAGVTLD